MNSYDKICVKTLPTPKPNCQGVVNRQINTNLHPIYQNVKVTSRNVSVKPSFCDYLFFFLCIQMFSGLIVRVIGKPALFSRLFSSGKLLYCRGSNRGSGDNSTLKELKATPSLFDRNHQHIDCYV